MSRIDNNRRKHQTLSISHNYSKNDIFFATLGCHIFGDHGVGPSVEHQPRGPQTKTLSPGPRAVDHGLGPPGPGSRTQGPDPGPSSESPDLDLGTTVLGPKRRGRGPEMAPGTGPGAEKVQKRKSKATIVSRQKVHRPTRHFGAAKLLT